MSKLTTDISTTTDTPRGTLSRRELLGLGGAVLLGGGIAAGLRGWSRHEHGRRADAFIARARDYDVDLVSPIRDGLHALGVSRAEVRGKRILLKPNLVETARGEPHINTHSAVVVAAAEAFLTLGAGEVIVAEGQGHRRDSELVLDESGMGGALESAGLRFVDLNHDEVRRVDNIGTRTRLTHLYLPETVLRADWIVSMPKLKTHHWAGVTCGMKNLFGLMPGIVYGWPKNVLHMEGIVQSILDINTTVAAMRGPMLTIVDGIIGMEGDGPIMGEAKQVGCLLMGRNAAAVDATATRVMGLNPYGVKYLSEASGRLGPIHEWNIRQRGEPINAVRTRFDVLDVPHLAGIVAG